MDQKRHMMDQKGLKMYEKRQKIDFLDLKYLFLAEFSLAELGGTPSPPLNGKSAKLFQKFSFPKRTKN